MVYCTSEGYRPISLPQSSRRGEMVDAPAEDRQWPELPSSLRHRDYQETARSAQPAATASTVGFTVPSVDRLHTIYSSVVTDTDRITQVLKISEQQTLNPFPVCYYVTETNPTRSCNQTTVFPKITTTKKKP